MCLLLLFVVVVAAAAAVVVVVVCCLLFVVDVFIPCEEEQEKCALQRFEEKEKVCFLTRR